jgi:uncharacterized protein YkwD
MNKLYIIILILIMACNKKSSSSDASLPPYEQPDTSTGQINTPTVEDNSPSVPKTWTQEFMDLLNAHRTSIGLRALIHHDEIGAIARKHSENMANGSVPFGHTGFSDRCSKSRSVLGGGNWCAENVAAGQKSPQSVFNSWMSSPGHRGNIENARASYTGLGYVKNNSGKYYWTQVFIEY